VMVIFVTVVVVTKENAAAAAAADDVVFLIEIETDQGVVGVGSSSSSIRYCCKRNDD